jgi:transposase InsO family protein
MEEKIWEGAGFYGDDSVGEREPATEEGFSGSIDGAGHLKKSRGHLLDTPEMRYRHINRLSSEFPVKKMCRLFLVERSAYYGWLQRGESKRSIEDRTILAEIIDIRKDERKRSYGAPRMQAELQSRHRDCGRNRTARIMRKANIVAKTKKKWKATTNSGHHYPVAANLLEQNFLTDRPDRIWTSDITYIWTEEGWLYLCIVLDLFSRKVVGWCMSECLKKEIVLSAINHAVLRRRPVADVIFHSDRGVQYACNETVELLKKFKFIQSMSRKGNCYDNAVTESFFHTLKTEHVFWRKYKTRAEARQDIFNYIESFYNRERRHSKLDYISPADYENNWLKNVA